jgi:hypothetical protein
MTDRLGKIRVYVRITPPHVGLYYSAVCPHGSSDMHFDSFQVEATTGVEKVSRLGAAHRIQTGCSCIAEDEVSVLS